jgi:hypothetical protein
VSWGCCAVAGREEPCRGAAVTHGDQMRVAVGSCGRAAERRSEVAMGMFSSILGSTGHDLLAPLSFGFGSAQPVGRF